MSQLARAIIVSSVGVFLTMRPALGQTPTGGSTPLRSAVAAYERGETRNFRIVGGREAFLYDNPWQVALVAAAVPKNLVAQFCGGSIVAQRWVITAAHCLDKGTLPQQVEVLSGTVSLSGGGHRVTVAEDGIHVHPQWNGSAARHDFDIALVEVTGNLAGEPIAAPPSAWSGPAVGQMIRITGWGALEFASSARVVLLQEGAVPYVTTTKCNELASYNGQVTENMFCAGLSTGGQDSCAGDSGGPATVMIGTTHRLLGIISWGEGCGAPDKYGVYTRVAKFRKWISETTGGVVAW